MHEHVLKPLFFAPAPSPCSLLLASLRLQSCRRLSIRSRSCHETFAFRLASSPGGLLAQGGLPNQPYIYVEGKAEMEKSADLIYLNFRVEARNPERPKANEQVQAKAKKVFALLKDAKIPEWDIVVQDLSSEPKYESDDSDPKKRGKLIGYSVSPV